jgi:FtsZ-binding cell division protein ZapB
MSGHNKFQVEIAELQEQLKVKEQELSSFETKYKEAVNELEKTVETQKAQEQVWQQREQEFKTREQQLQ